MKNNVCFRRFGTMLDCSRNAVMKVESVKKWIDITVDLGYNTLLLYTEDTYEVNNNPYFGYMRGRYSKAELRAIDDYAMKKGMELIPCIQTLAHLNAIVRWPEYASHIDTDDILLAGDERVYNLIDSMFSSISECFTSRIVNIGMDEAHMIGRGRHYDQHGDVDRFEILTKHLNRVADIGKKYGFTLTMWSDMFFRLAAGGEYYESNADINEEIIKQIPDNVQLIYWDYYNDNKEHYNKMMSAHKKMKDDTWFAGGLWAWGGFSPCNGFAIKVTVPALESCRECGVQDAFLTIWGDNGAECSKFAMLPSLFYASEIAKGNTEEGSIKRKFRDKYGVEFDVFMLLDLPKSPKGENVICNPEKYLFYNDCFTGLLDSTLEGGENEKYAEMANLLEKVRTHKEWGYLFDTQHKLCEVLSVKAELGAKTRKVYNAQDRDKLRSLIQDYLELQKRVEDFYATYKHQWFKENKPHGFDVQDIRIGGVMQRIKSCADRLQQLYDGKIDVIEELEERQLDFCGGCEKFDHQLAYYNDWKGTVTANVL